MIAKLLQTRPIRARKNLTKANNGMVYAFVANLNISVRGLRNLKSTELILQENFAFMKPFRNKIGMSCRGKGQY